MAVRAGTRALGFPAMAPPRHARRRGRSEAGEAALLEPKRTDGDRPPRWWRRRPGLVAVLSVVVVAVVSLIPAAVHGTVLAPFDMLSLFGLGHQAGVTPHNVIDSDLLQQDVPWMNLAWTQVHRGHLPLWNSYDGLGMPLGLDFITASFSVPTLFTYLVPLQYGLIVSVLAKLVIAGTGVYYLGRVMGLRHGPAAFAGMVFELSGAFTVWLGWSQTGVMAWLGWLVAVALLMFRGEHRVRNVVLFAAFLACSVYGGHPESNIICMVALAMIVAVLLARRLPVLGGSGALRQPVVDLALGSLAGLGLSAPLWLPAAQLTTGTARFGSSGSSLLPLSYLGNFVFQGYDGYPISGSQYFGQTNYYEITVYVGVTVLVLAALGAVMHWRRVEVQALVAMMVVLGAVIFVPPVFTAVEHLPHAGGVNWHRGLIPISLGFSVLAGMGLEALVRQGMTRRVQHVALGAFGVAALGLVAVGVRSAVDAASLPPGASAIRARSFVWPVTQTVVGLAVMAVLIMLRRRDDRQASPADAPGDVDQQVGARGRRAWVLAAAGMLAASAVAFLALADGPLWSPHQTYFPVTAADAAYQRAVGTSAVGFGVCPSVTGYADLGILPDANIGYHVQQFAFYETAVAPEDYYRSWARATGKPLVVSSQGVFCGAITSVTLARRYGLSYVLEPAGTPGPPGTVRRAVVGTEDLYAVPDSGPATLAPAADGGSVSGRGTPLAVTHPDTATWRIETAADHPSVLFLRLTDVPGWGATVDGASVPVRQWDKVMIEVPVPAGRHTVMLTYWPPKFTEGLWLAALTVLALAGASMVALRRRRAASVVGGDGGADEG